MCIMNHLWIAKSVDNQRVGFIIHRASAIYVSYALMLRWPIAVCVLMCTMSEPLGGSDKARQAGFFMRMFWDGRLLARLRLAVCRLYWSEIAQLSGCSIMRWM